MSEALSDQERGERLETEIQRRVAEGYRVQHRTAFSAQLVKPKQFNAGLAILGLLFLVVGLLIYLLAYAAQQDETLYLSIDEAGAISYSGSGQRAIAAIRSGGRVVAPAGRTLCPACGYASSGNRKTCKACHVALTA